MHFFPIASYRFGYPRTNTLNYLSEKEEILLTWIKHINYVVVRFE